MAITTADGWFAAARQKLAIIKTATNTSVAATQTSLWSIAGAPGAGSLAIGNTTTGVLFTDATAGAPLIKAFGGGATGYLAQVAGRCNVAGGLAIYDRIWGAGSVSATAAATTTFSSNPSITGRLPGGNDYGDLELMIETATATTGATFAINIGYTNEAGTTGRTTGAIVLGVTGIGRITTFPLQAGDKGIQRVESVTVTVAGTAGTFNVILARRLCNTDGRVANYCDIQAWDALGAPEVFDTSCLWLVSQPDSTSTGLPSVYFTIING